MIQPGYTVGVHDHGFVRYVDHLGSDTRIVEAARVSYGQGSKGPEADQKLLEYLYKMRHTSPFEQCNITFEIQMPIFVMRQFVRHRTFRLNEISGRYALMPDIFYIPHADEWRLQDKKNKQGSNGYLPATDEVEDAGEDYTLLLKNFSEEAYTQYVGMVEAGIANEMARLILPVNIYTRIYVNCDLHNLLHFLRLRMDPHAQKEIRDFAEVMYEFVVELFPWTAEAFSKYKWSLQVMGF